MVNTEKENVNSLRDWILSHILVNNFDRACAGGEWLEKTSNIIHDRDFTGDQQGEDTTEENVLSYREETKDQQSLPGTTLTSKKVAGFVSLFLEEFMTQVGTDATAELLESIGKEKARSIKRAIGNGKDETGSGDQLRKLIASILEIYDNHGKYPVMVEDESCFTLESHNCLLYSILKGDPLICKVDEAMMAELFGFQPFKAKCIREGDGYCKYRIKKGNYGKVHSQYFSRN